MSSSPATSELLDCRNDIIVTEDKGHLIAAIGLQDIVIAHTPDATLVCHVSQTERLKTLLGDDRTARPDEIPVAERGRPPE